MNYSGRLDSVIMVIPTRVIMTAFRFPWAINAQDAEQNVRIGPIQAVVARNMPFDLTSAAIDVEKRISLLPMLQNR